MNSTKRFQHLNSSQPLSPIAGMKKGSLLRFTGGTVGYSYSYRSTVDTPFLYNDLAQHQVTANFGILVANNIPIRINAYARRSNSSYFPNITDIQVAFDARAFRENVAAKLRKQLEDQAYGIKDSLAQKLAVIKQLEALRLRSWINSPLTNQKFTNAHDILNVAGKSYNPKTSDSANNLHSDSLKRVAKAFLKLYQNTVEKYHMVSKEADSIKKIYQTSVAKYNSFRQSLNGPLPTGAAYNTWKSKLEESSGKPVDLPSTDRWLLGVRSFGLGRNTLNYSDLTVKNVSVTGINFEYNSWYYMAFAAGLVDYRFRDFVTGPQSNAKQYVYLGRIGLGSLQRNYVILSAYQGQKQLFAATTTGSTLGAIHITGFSFETKWQVNSNTFVLAEVGESFSPDFQLAPPTSKSKWDLSDKTNKALALRFSSFFPKSLTRVDASYKFTGSNFQSFSSFQTNAQIKTWSVKLTQPLFDRHLQLTASLRTNDFSNPYVLQNYSSNTVFKTLNLTFRAKNLPVISAGYMPVSQLTMLGSQVVENQFQTFTASINHYYKIAQQQVATSLIYTRFFNTGTDTSYLFYHSNNLYFSHTIFFKHFSGNITVSHTSNHNFDYNVMDENFNIQISRTGAIGAGVKIHSLVGQENKLGEYINTNLRITKKDVIYINIENGYLPGNANRLVKNAMGNISYTRNIK